MDGCNFYKGDIQYGNYSVSKEEMYMDKKAKVISIKDSKQKKQTVDITDKDAVLVVEGEPVFLEEFVISGRTTDGSIITSTFNLSLEESIFYKEIIDLSLKEELRRRLSTSD